MPVCMHVYVHVYTDAIFSVMDFVLASSFEETSQVSI